ncbi:MAG TPA: acyl-CoA dehydrogenase family protein [Polyangiaceae bacterium LLY-WYZ-15_(1-7)]|nr:isovaleryl-CoA dehydrogenase [Sandaracinus sp.]HJK92871.1 acyl-CoA dehydrogenase family protein [Polyangiaceae bacterium LLY-WYZ-15_(1-7)]HJL05301.1 acyl-CoA dehydrogenase family protein [Polyangiaceae bacterium LLY-WYZ-15_(1-7)]HJL07919.1 acyl-CoA dehydrogenase family protein [Polyangiaceae bacterium LLY-WYZ-15_(1-7)]HJL25795.1 acyl-CoA dehydrogenase family protein [Polyangiaceae bacterium LLY-WYZ-15_(1-7)]
MPELDLFNPTPEHAQLREMVRRFAESEVEPQALEHDRTETFNVALFRKLGELGLLGITAQEEFGGTGLDPVAACIVHEELSAVDPGFTLAYLAHSMLFVNNLAQNGSDAQRKKYLPAACSGEAICGMCMSEPDAGTDVLGMRTTAKRDGDHYVLDGAKMWITNGAISKTELGDTFLVYARVEGAGRSELSMFIVEKGMAGFSLGQKIEDKLGMRASTTAELVFEGCRVPVENRVGEEGTATLHMMRNLEIERVTLAAMSLGIARRSVEVMNEYARDRKSFGEPLNRFGQIQRHIAESYAEYMAGRAYTYLIASQMDLAKPGQRLDTDGVKLFCSTMGKNVADRAIQVLGGYGYTGEYRVERLWRDAKLLEIGGGTIEAHQKNMTRDLSRLEKLK